MTTRHELIDASKRYTDAVECFINYFKSTWYATSPNVCRMIATTLMISTLNTGKDDFDTCYQLVQAVYFAD